MDDKAMLRDLLDTIFEFIADLSSILVDEVEQGDLTLIEFYFRNSDPKLGMNHVITHLLPYKNDIESRKMSFFKDSPSIFAGLPEERVLYYRNAILNQNRLTADDLDIIWQYCDVLISLAENYKNNN